MASLSFTDEIRSDQTPSLGFDVCQIWHQNMGPGHGWFIGSSVVVSTSAACLYVPNFLFKTDPLRHGTCLA